RVLVAGRRHVEAPIAGERIAVCALDELQVEVVTVSGRSKAQPRDELVRLGDGLLRLEIAAVPAEAEDLPAAVRALGLDPHLRADPGGPALLIETKPRRHAVLEDHEACDAVPCVDATRLSVPVAVMMITMIVMVIVQWAIVGLRRARLP